MQLFVHYDKQGQIISVSKTDVLADSLAHPYGEVTEDGGVLEVEPTDELVALDCHEIGAQYVVDVARQRLKKRPARRTGRK